MATPVMPYLQIGIIIYLLSILTNINVGYKLSDYFQVLKVSWLMGRSYQVNYYQFVFLDLSILYLHNSYRMTSRQ